MRSSRFVLHPILSHPKNRLMFLCFMVFALLFGAFCYWKVNAILNMAGVNVVAGRFTTGFLPDLLLSIHFRVAIIFLTTLLATSVAGYKIAGPLHRIENWLKVIEEGKNPGELAVRKGDKFHYLVQLFNEFHKLGDSAPKGVITHSRSRNKPKSNPNP